MRADRDDDDALAALARYRRRRRHQTAKKAGHAAAQRRKRDLDLDLGTALCALLNRIDGRPGPITDPADFLGALAILQRGRLWGAILERRPLAMLITPDAVAADDLVAALRALPDGWRPDLDVETPPRQVEPIWMALTSLARAVAAADADDRLLHLQMVALHRECGFDGAASADPVYAASCKAAHHLLQAFLAKPLAWRQRLGRCAYPPCAAPYFLDQSADERKRFCTTAHQQDQRRRARAEQRAQQAAWRPQAPARGRVAERIVVATGRPAARNVGR